MNKKILILLILISGFFQISTQAAAFSKQKKVYTPLDEYKYEQKTLQNLEKEKYERSILPTSGYMSTEEYEALSKDVLNSEKVVPEPPVKSSSPTMEYIPQPVWVLEKYNTPPGNDELDLKSTIKFKHQLNGEGVTSPDKTFMVYPVTYFYPESQTTAGDLFVIPLDTTLSDVDRILRANIIKRNPTPIISTEKDINECKIFRTLTPVDFSADSTKLLAKEKIGYVNDGIWQTNIWIYDFQAQHAIKLDKIRNLIVAYWQKTAMLYLNQKRWDIFPVGFDANNPDKIVIQAYAYTGNKPFFLGTWEINDDNTDPILISPSSTNVTISTNAYHLVKSGYRNPVTIKIEQKLQAKTEKKRIKVEKQLKKQELKTKKQALKTKLKAMKKQEQNEIKLYKQNQIKSAPLGN